MENNKKKYYNRAQLVKANRGVVKDFKVLDLMFSVWDGEQSKTVNKFHKLFLTQENNDRNAETIQLLGGEKLPIVSYDTVSTVNGLGTRTVDLVCETNEAGYENVKFINEPKFGVRVYDM